MSALKIPEGDSFPAFVLARTWNTSPHHIANLIDDGELEGVDLRGKQASRSTLRVSRESVIAFVERRRTGNLNGHAKNGHAKNGKAKK